MTDIFTLRPCAVFKLHRGGLAKFPVAHGEGETPLPIPNRAVKPLSADGTWRATSWESRSPPVLSLGRPSGRPFFVGRLEAVLAECGEIDQEVDGIGQPSGQWGLLRVEHKFESTAASGWNAEIAGVLAMRAWPRRRLQRRLLASACVRCAFRRRASLVRGFANVRRSAAVCAGFSTFGECPAPWIRTVRAPGTADA